jgi:nitrogen fixation NifU-like protein
MEPLSRYRPEVIDHVRHPRNPGRVTAPDGEGEAENPPCGDLVRITLRLNGERVTQARFQAEGCPATLASASALTELLAGLTRTQAEAVDPDAVAEALGGLPAGRFHGAELACRAARAALRGNE